MSLTASRNQLQLTAQHVRTLADTCENTSRGGGYAKRAQQLVDRLDGWDMDRQASELAYAVFYGGGTTGERRGVRHAKTDSERAAAIQRIRDVATSLDTLAERAEHR